ncbi:MAG: hypothetical protein EXQ59_01160 [Acidobacteria bacterium]|nr:hypothetical protein [Acidobacteriota bacterium]
MGLKRLLKRGALLAAANWPILAIEFVAETTFQVLLAVPIIGAAILVAVLLGANLVELLQGNLREIFSTVAGTLRAEPVGLVAFVTAFGLMLLGGSILTFLVKGGIVDVLLAASTVAGRIEQEPVTIDTLRGAASFTVERFTTGCARHFRRYLALGLTLTLVYLVSAGAYVAFIVYGYRMASGSALVIGWTLLAALSAGALVVWITLINLLYLLMQIAIAVEGVGLADAGRRVARFVVAEFSELAAVFGVVLVLVVIATFASALAWSGVGLVAFVPLVGLAVVPLQIAALFVRGLVFEYLGLTALGAYLTLYTGYLARRPQAQSAVAGDSPLEHLA